MAKIQLPCGYAWVDETIGVNNIGSFGAKCLSAIGGESRQGEAVEDATGEDIVDRFNELLESLRAAEIIKTDSTD